MQLTDVAIVDGHRTPRDAADVFAREFWGDNSRRVGVVQSPYGDLRFMLVDGTHWYRVVLINGKYLIQREDEA